MGAARMIFDRLSAPLALALLLGVGLIVLVLYWLRPPAPAVQIASTLTWRRLAERSRRTRRWRRLVSLLLSLIAAGAMAAALAGLRIAPPGADGPPLVIVVDTSATMATATAGGPSRLERAVTEARGEVATSAGPVDLYDTTGQLVRAGLPVGEALRLLGTLEVHPSRASLFPTAALGPRPGREPKRLFYSDGVTPLDAPPGFERHSVFQPAINVGIVAFEAARSGSLVQAFVEVLNGSLEPVVAELLLDTVAGEILVRRPLQLAPAERWSGVIDLAPLADVVAASPVLRARISSEGDALPVDDLAFAPVPLGAPLEVAFSGPGGSSVRRVLELLDGFSVLDVDAELAGDLGPEVADILVLEERAPDRSPRLPTLLIAPPERSWLPTREAELGPSTWAPVDAETPTLNGLRVEAIARYATGDDGQEGAGHVVFARPASDRGAGGSIPLLLRSPDDRLAPWILFPFAVEGSNLPTRGGFPTLVEALLLELAGRERAGVIEAGVLELGELEPDDLGLDESTATFEVSDRRFAELEQPILLDEGNGVARAVAPLGPGVSALNHSDWVAVDSDGREPGIGASSTSVSWRHLLLGAGLVVALLELWTRSRGFTE